MSELMRVINGLTGMVHLRGALPEEIERAEKELGLCFAEDYREYLLNFGTVSADGIELTGLNVSARLNVIDVTKEERRYGRNFPEQAYIVENPGIGNLLILQEASGIIYEYERQGKRRPIAASLSEYLENR